MRKFLIGLCLSLIVLLGIGAATLAPFQIRGPHGEDEKIANATFALYASSQTAGIQNRFICTAEAISVVTDNSGRRVGYVLLTAGHCTPKNPEIPGDTTYAVSPDLGGKPMPVTIIKAVMKEPLDFALLYLPTTQQFDVDDMESVGKVRVGDRVTDVNFALGIAKQYSHGRIGSQIIHDADPELNGDFLVQMDGGPGSSGSGVLHDGKLIGIVIYGFNEGTVGMGVEPIDAIIRAIPSTPNYVAPPVSDEQDFFRGNGSAWPFGWSPSQRGHFGGHPGRRMRPQEPREPREPRQPRDGRASGPRARSHQGPEGRRHIDRGNRRFVRGRLQFCFAGTWFWAPAPDPAWLWTDEVYIVQVGPDTYEVIDFWNPTLFFYATIVD